MKVTEITNKHIADKITQRLIKERTGMHLSDLDLCLRRAYYKRMFPKPLTLKQAIMYALGYALQEYMYPQMEISVEVEGVFCSPDVWELGKEVKSTRAGIKIFDPAKPHWISRMKGYCYVTGKRVWGLDVVFIIPSEVRSWEFEFTDQEVLDNWKVVQRKKGELEEAFKTKTAPLIPYNAEWECRSCEFAGYCL